MMSEPPPVKGDWDDGQSLWDQDQPGGPTRWNQRPRCCPPLIPAPPVEDCVVRFNYQRWLIRFPEFRPTLTGDWDNRQTLFDQGARGGPSRWDRGAADPLPPDPNPMAVSAELAQELFYDATMYLDNSCRSPVCDASVGGERERLLFWLVAHLAYLRGPGSGMGDVGHATSKSVGPVSVGYTLEGITANAAWFAQSGYGLAFWQGTQQYRVFRYRAAPRYWGPGWSSAAWTTSYGNPLPFAQSVTR